MAKSLYISVLFFPALASFLWPKAAQNTPNVAYNCNHNISTSILNSLDWWRPECQKPFHQPIYLQQKKSAVGSDTVWISGNWTALQGQTLPWFTFPKCNSSHLNLPFLGLFTQLIKILLPFLITICTVYNASSANLMRNIHLPFWKHKISQA